MYNLLGDGHETIEIAFKRLRSGVNGYDSWTSSNGGTISLEDSSAATPKPKVIVGLEGKKN